ncbi:DUF3823 domain-containing protein [Sphingobacterium mizutaii]|uniref:DUF3823 domain-containing protein n=1 Tax=Sphingobacterium mizutaii TaxID=1010 RepID=UPI0016287A05|nr:DUF3823 domain-containing protein [Sphingobacterium mizutaii]
MKRINILAIGLFLSLALLFSCGKDNYDAPNANLTGKVTYKGAAVGVRGSNNSVRLQLWQDGYALKNPIDVFVTQDGSFSAALFNGTYKLITVPGNGPWKSKTDTMTVQLNGNTNIDFPVELYYDLKDIKYQLNGNNLTATFNVEKLDPSKTLDDINLLVGKTKFVDLGHFLKRANKSGDSNGNVTLTVDIGPELQSNPILFARVAAKINGITEAIYDANIHQVK